MDRGGYAAASAGMLQMTKMEIANNNLANLNTPGFKRQFLISEEQAFENTLASKMNEVMPFAEADHERVSGTEQIRSVTDFSMGAIQTTDNPLDAALTRPDEFFVVATPDGPRYTRAGNFTLNAENQLVTQDGFPVSVGGGAVALEGGRASIDAAGNVLAGGVPIGQLDVVQIADPEQLERVGSTRFQLREGAPAPAAAENVKLVPRSLEMANVSAIQSMVELIAATRGFELYSKSAQTIDQMDEQAITQVGRKGS